MLEGRWDHVVLLSLVLLFTACAEKKEEKSKVQEAVKEAITKELKLYEGAKQSLEKIQKESQERIGQEKEAK